jgi:hypothetical protein
LKQHEVIFFEQVPRIPKQILSGSQYAGGNVSQIVRRAA